MSAPGFRLTPIARLRLDDIYRYTCDVWGEVQADRYSADLFAFFADIAARKIAWRMVPAEFGFDGYYGRCGHHYVYWRATTAGQVGIVTILHERMHQIAQFRRDLAP